VTGTPEYRDPRASLGFAPDPCSGPARCRVPSFTASDSENRACGRERPDRHYGDSLLLGIRLAG
jgi:hypothetical protein